MDVNANANANAVPAYELSAYEQAAGLTENEAIALRHRRNGYSYRLIAGYVGPGVTARDASRLAHAAKRKIEAAHPGLRPFIIL